jgi:hypothetical protein
MILIYQNASQVIVWQGDNVTGPEGLLSDRVDYQLPIHYQYQALSGVCAVVNAWRERSGYDTIIPVATHSSGLIVPLKET